MALVSKTTRDASGAEFSIYFDDAIVGALTPVSLLYGPIPTGSNVIGGVTQSGTWNVGVTGTADVNIVSGSVTAVFTGSLPAGTNNIGDVDVVSLPALPAGTNNIGDVDVLTVPTTATSTREYSLANAIRVAFTSTSTTEAALPTLGTTREVRLCASARCWIKWGTTAISTPSVQLFYGGQVQMVGFANGDTPSSHLPCAAREFYLATGTTARPITMPTPGANALDNPVFNHTQDWGNEGQNIVTRGGSYGNAPEFYLPVSLADAQTSVVPNYGLYKAAPGIITGGGGDDIRQVFAAPA